jgi:glyoxylase-like metal-dependent hydrolase (beta-lactamase superfamily II)
MERHERMIDALVNTHHHGDHTDGNAVCQPSVRRIVAHRRVPELQRSAGERFTAAPGSRRNEGRSGWSREEITALDRLPAFPDHVAITSLLSLAAPLGPAFDEVSATR